MSERSSRRTTRETAEWGRASGPGSLVDPASRPTSRSASRRCTAHDEEDDFTSPLGVKLPLGSSKGPPKSLVAEGVSPMLLSLKVLKAAEEMAIAKLEARMCPTAGTFPCPLSRTTVVCK